MPLYNKERYIGQALRSIFEQCASFHYQIYILDDASTDNSLAIARDFQRSHPTSITIFTNSQNAGCLANSLRGYALLDSPYFCVLDPDDYWIDPHFIQKALTFLENNRRYTLYSNNCYILDDHGMSPYHAQQRPVTFNFSCLSRMRGHTSATIFRNIIFNKGVDPSIQAQVGTNNEKSFEGDSFRNLLHLSKGDGIYIDNIASVYRITGDGIWTKHSKHEQSLHNARFFLTMFSYFGSQQPQFFLPTGLQYCLRAINQYFRITNSSTRNRPAILSEILDLLRHYYALSRNSATNNKKLPHSFVFYCPSRVTSGYEYLFCRLARFLSENFKYKVYYIDYSDGFARGQLEGARVTFIDPTTKRIRLRSRGPHMMIAPITLAAEIPRFANKDVKQLFWCAHPKSFPWLMGRTQMKKDKAIKLVKRLAATKSICFMDKACWHAFSRDTATVFPEKYVPVFAPTKMSKGSCRRVPCPDNELNIGWVGRLDGDKIHSLLNLIHNIYQIDCRQHVNVHVIGTGDAASTLYSVNTPPNVHILQVGRLINEDLDSYLASNVSVMFGMGISVLEAAALRIPSVITLSGEHPFDTDEFIWLFQTTNGLVGLYEWQRGIIENQPKSLATILEDICTVERKQRIGDLCYEHVQRFHTIENTLALLFVHASTVATNKCAKNTDTMSTVYKYTKPYLQRLLAAITGSARTRC